MYLYLSLKDDPAWHAALEEYWVRHAPEEADILLLYVNRPAVVIGKNQNPWQECDVEWIEREGVALIRRISGGGTVVHDPGNLNFAFITTRTLQQVNDYRPFLQPVIAYLKTLGLTARQSERNDILIDGLKISGNAQFTSRNRLLSHGTLLFNSDLSRLSRALRTPRVTIHSHSRPSVRGPVGNMASRLKRAVSFRQFREGLAAFLLDHFGDQGRWRLSAAEEEAVWALARTRYAADNWRYGRTPRFTLETPDAGGLWRVTVTGGKIEKAEIAGRPALTKICRALTGTPFRYQPIRDKLKATVEFESIKPYTLPGFTKKIYPFYEE